MKLEPVNPFDYHQYCHRILVFAEWMTEYVQKNKIDGYIGWLDQFKRYKYNSGRGSWKDGVKDRCDFHKKLTSIVSKSNNQQLVNIANSIILDFGGIPERYKYELKDAGGIRQALVILSNETNKSGLFTPPSIESLFNFTPRHRIASHSKIYEMFDPHKWAIYDARVATALVCLVWQFWKQKGVKIEPASLTFPVPSRNKRNWKRPHPDEFPRLYGYKKGQASLAFIYCSWLLRLVAEILRADPKYSCPATTEHANEIAPLDANWQVHHVEMALWMLGDKEF
jgi:hypothetical protein